MTSSASYPGNDRIGNPVGLEQLADALHPRVEVGLELVGQLLTRGLVVRIPLVSEAEAGVMNPAEVLGTVIRE